MKELGMAIMKSVRDLILALYDIVFKVSCQSQLMLQIQYHFL